MSRASVCRLPFLRKLNDKRWIRRTFNQFQEYLKKHSRPDIIIAHSSLLAGVVADRIKKYYSIPYILVEHRGRFTADNILADIYLDNVSRDLYLSAFQSADKIVCVSESLMKGIQLKTGIPNDRFRIIPNMADHNFFKFPPQSRETIPFIFLSVGMLEYVKGFDILLRAFAEFTEKVDGEFFLRIGGKGSLGKSLKLLAIDLGISDRVSFLGKISRERVCDEMQKANVFISSSRFESFGIVLVESAFTGLPLIATRSGGPQSIINENNGILVEIENISSLEKAMENMYFNYPDFKQDLIREQAIEKYSGRTIVTQYHNLIREILNEA